VVALGALVLVALGALVLVALFFLDVLLLFFDAPEVSITTVSINPKLFPSLSPRTSSPSTKRDTLGI